MKATPGLLMLLVIVSSICLTTALKLPLRLVIDYLQLITYITYKNESV